MTEDTMIGRYLAARTRAADTGDARVVAEIDVQLARLGHRPDMPPAEQARVADRAETDARPRRGRPPARRDL